MDSPQSELSTPLNSATRVGSFSRLLAHAQVPLYRNAYAWMVSTAISSALGIVYWFMAARYYTAENVGLSATVISTVIFISGISQLNLTSMLIRFIPNAGAATHRLIRYSYMIAIFVTTVVGILVISVIHPWSAELAYVSTYSQFALAFVGATVMWSVFTIQDSVLTGLRDAIWVPIENVSYAVVKIILLVIFAKAWPEYGIFASWMIPAAVAVLPVNLAIFGRLVPRHVRTTKAQARPIGPKLVSKYVAGNYVGALALLASVRLVPVLVTHEAGAQAGAYFFLAWTIANSLKLITTNMTMSLTVEGAHDQTRASIDGWHFLIALSRILLPMVAVLVLGAPYILRIVGHDYSTEGTLVLRLLALSVVPGMLTSVYVGLARVRNRAAAIMVVQGAFCILVLTLSLVLLRPFGITGVGVAFLISETLIAVSLLALQLRPRLRKAFGAPGRQ